MLRMNDAIIPPIAAIDASDNNPREKEETAIAPINPLICVIKKGI